MIEFKAGDRVMFVEIPSYFKENPIINIDINKVYEVLKTYPTMEVEDYSIELTEDFGDSSTSYLFLRDFFKLVERKINDTWVKAEALNEMENKKFKSENISFVKVNKSNLLYSFSAENNDLIISQGSPFYSVIIQILTIMGKDYMQESK